MGYAARIPRARRYWVAFRSILTKEVRRFMRIWVQTLVPPAITMSLYFVIFGNLIGPRVGIIDGFDYIDYIVPGIIMMSVITNSYANVVSSFFSAKFQRNIEEMLVAPVPSMVILLGYVGGGVVRGLMVGLVVTVVSMLFIDLDIAHPLITVSVVVMTATLFSLGGLINAVFASKFDDISIVPTFILTPLTYLGGVFYSISMLSPFWQAVSQINPILYMVNAFRFGFLGVSDIQLTTAYGIVIGFIIALTSWALYLLNRGVGIRT
ncbi:MAG: ABC transporter permease [Pseudomonadota bacterium]|nr:ABC transporter permease [Pseudomonadota bacterium]